MLPSLSPLLNFIESGLDSGFQARQKLWIQEMTLKSFGEWILDDFNIGENSPISHDFHLTCSCNLGCHTKVSFGEVSATTSGTGASLLKPWRTFSNHFYSWASPFLRPQPKHLSVTFSKELSCISRIHQFLAQNGPNRDAQQIAT